MGVHSRGSYQAQASLIRFYEPDASKGAVKFFDQTIRHATSDYLWIETAREALSDFVTLL
jgi:hypothetical protein